MIDDYGTRPTLKVAQDMASKNAVNSWRAKEPRRETQKSIAERVSSHQHVGRSSPEKSRDPDTAGADLSRRTRGRGRPGRCACGGRGRGGLGIFAKGRRRSRDPAGEGSIGHGRSTLEDDGLRLLGGVGLHRGGIVVQHVVNDMDHASREEDVGEDDLGAVDKNILTDDLNGDLGPAQSSDVLVLQVAAVGHGVGDDVVVEDLRQLLRREVG